MWPMICIAAQYCYPNLNINLIGQPVEFKSCSATSKNHKPVKLANLFLQQIKPNPEIQIDFDNLINKKNMKSTS